MSKPSKPKQPNLVSILLTAALGLAPLLGCESVRAMRQPNELPAGAGAGNATTAADAQLADDAHPIRRVIGGGLGAGGGFLIGADPDKLDVADKAQCKADAVKASQRAEKNPARPDDVDRAPTADLNKDGYVTLDEVVALRQANVNDQAMLDRLQRTGHVFELTEYQQDYLRTRGVSDAVLRQIPTLNPAAAPARTAAQHEPGRRDTTSANAS